MAVESVLTRDEMTALFNRRQEAFDNMDEFRDRKIIRETRIYDFTGVLIQIGLLKAKPS